MQTMGVGGVPRVPVALGLMPRRTLGLLRPGHCGACFAYRIMNPQENQQRRVLLPLFTSGETEKQLSKYHCYLGAKTRLDPRGLASRTQEGGGSPDR